jgi:hypothetical protein
MIVAVRPVKAWLRRTLSVVIFKSVNENSLACRHCTINQRGVLDRGEVPRWM